MILVHLAIAVLSPLGAQTITVTTAIDEDDGDLDPSSGTGQGISLREAINHSPPASDVVFDAALDGQVILLGPLVLDKNLSVDASDLRGGLTIDAAQSGRLLEVRPEITVVLDSLTLTGGRAARGSVGNGGAVFNAGSLSLRNSTVSQSSASGTGGGVWNEGSLLLEESTVSGNSAGSGGGGIGNAGSLAIRRSTVSGNSSFDPFGGEAAGGGVRNESGGSAIVSNSTISGNSASRPGGGIWNGGGATLRISSSTIASNESGDAAGIRNLGALTLENTVIAGNFAGWGFYEGTPDLGNGPAGTVVVNGVNLLSDPSGSGLTPGPAVIVGQPRLAPLGNYGGPTRTMPPLPGSPAIDAAMVTAGMPETDQRGDARPVDGDRPPDGTAAPDIGAVEIGEALVVTNTNDSGEGSLRATMAAARPGSRLLFDASLDGATLTLAGTPLTLDKELAIEASDLRSGFTIDAGGGSRVLEVSSGSRVTLDSLMLTGGRVAGDRLPGEAGPANSGGGIFNRGHLTMNRVTVAGNTATVGGGVRNSGTLTIGHSALTGNSAIWTIGAFTDGGVAGGIRNDSGGVVTIHDSTLSGNSAWGPYDGFAGDIDNRGTLRISRSRFFASSAGIEGGSILYYGSLTVDHGSFSSHGYAGAISNHGNAAIRDCTVSGNSARSAGGISASAETYGSTARGTVLIANSTIAGNTAVDEGGGIVSSGDRITIASSTLSGNSAAAGGEIHDHGSVNLENSVVAGNAASSGSDILGNPRAPATTTGVNLLSDLSGSALSAGPAVIVGAPLLAPLGEYGGPTQTMPPLPGSPAIEGGTLVADTLPSDQLGNPRPGGALPDIGAVEAVPFVSLGLASMDGDAIPDLLEGPGSAYPHLDPTMDDSTLDTDRDGSTDAEELANMTDLFDPSDRLRITAFSHVGDNEDGAPLFEVSFTSFPGLEYTFERDQQLDFTNPTEIPAGNAAGFTTTRTITLSPGGADFARVRRR